MTSAGGSAVEFLNQLGEGIGIAMARAAGYTDMNDIDMTLPDFEVALAYTDGGSKRMLTTGEWAKLLRTDKRYGWNRTEQARQIGSDIATTIVQQFQRGF
jgi:hypothetical protein